MALAEAVIAQAELPKKPFQPLYDQSLPVKVKMEIIAKKMYGAGDIYYTKDAEKDLALIERLGYQGLPLCVAKTPASLSDDPKIVGRPELFGVTVRGFVIAAGAGYVVPLLGEILRMPGLPKEPQSDHIDLVDGEVVGMR